MSIQEITPNTVELLLVMTDEQAEYVTSCLEVGNDNGMDTMLTSLVDMIVDRVAKARAVLNVTGSDVPYAQVMIVGEGAVRREAAPNSEPVVAGALDLRDAATEAATDAAIAAEKSALAREDDGA